MTLQFGRYYQLTIGDVLISNLDIRFRVIKTGTQEPNTIDLTILNLNEDNRRFLQWVGSTTCRLEAGYQEDYGLLFLGDVRSIMSTYQRPNWHTDVSSGDGEISIQKGRINKSFAAGTDIATVIQEAAKGLIEINSDGKEVKIKTGNLRKALDKAKLSNGAKEFVNGITLSGKASRELDKVVKSAGLTWSIQDGQLQVLQRNEVLPGSAIVLRPDTGLIGSPTISSDGTLSFTALLDHKIVPGRQLSVESKHVNGRFKVERCEYSGDTSANVWYVSGEAMEQKEL